MYELHKVGDRTYYIDSPAKIGLYVEENGNTILIDSGNDKEAGRKINQHLTANGWALTAILNTHSNADHIGGNAFLQQRAHCAICGTGIENAFTQYPQLEPSFLYGGFPPKALRNKFLMAQPSMPTGDIAENLPAGFEILPLPGHYFGMVGIRTPDDIVFLADCLSGENIIQKYHINFLYDVEQYLATLSMLDTLAARLFIPAHAEPVGDIRPLAQANREKVQEIIALLSMLCYTPQTTEALIKAVFDHFSLIMDFNQYALVGSTIRSYLAYLLDAGSITAIFQDNRLLFQSPQI